MTFGVNDVFDVDSDLQNPRKTHRWTHGVALQSKDHAIVLKAARISSVIIFISALPAAANSGEVLIYTAIFTCTAWLYSTPPVRLKERPFQDSLSNGVICWAFWASGFVFSGDKTVLLASDPARRAGYLVFLYAVALHGLASVLDTRADVSVNHRTTSTVIGEQCAIGVSLLSLYVLPQ